MMMAPPTRKPLASAKTTAPSRISVRPLPPWQSLGQAPPLSRLTTPSRHGLLQRKSACGAPAMEVEACAPRPGKDRLQGKLTSGPADDPLEHEADRVAEQVLAMPAPPGIDRTAVKVQRATSEATDGAVEVPASVHKILSSPGRPLDRVVRRDMEARFGQDFSQVRIHTGAAAEQSASDVKARAYTVGSDVAFGAGE
jgi:hypothetical protein